MLAKLFGYDNLQSHDKIKEDGRVLFSPGRWRLWALLTIFALISVIALNQDYLNDKWWEFKIPRIVSQLDFNGNGINDTEDIIAGARLVVAAKPFYRSVYYEGRGYPPDDEGVCTDLIWRALKQAGYDLKSMMDADIKAHTKLYPRVRGVQDMAIDFRRVPNQRVFFSRFGHSLTTDLLPENVDNLSQWQPGDIVTFKDPDHVVILSTKRNAQGVPYLIHHSEPYPREADDFMARVSRGITGHYRFPKK